MRDRILKTLNAYLYINKDVLTESEIKDIEQQIHAIKYFTNPMVIDTEALQEVLNDFNIDANIRQSSNGWCELETNDSTYLLTKEFHIFQNKK